MWCVFFFFFSFCDQILCEKPTCEDRFQILFISCKIQPGASKMLLQWSPKGAKWTQKGPTLTKRAPKGDQKNIDKFAPGPGAARPRSVLSFEVSAVYLSSMHPFPAVGLVFAVFFFFLGGFHPGSLPFPPLSVV